jgi:Ca2+-binding RTX toxin-like protein
VSASPFTVAGSEESMSQQSLKLHLRVIVSFLATAVVVGAAAPGAFAATTVTYNSGGTSPGMNVTDDPGNAANLVVTSGTQNNHVGLRSNNDGPLTAGSGCLQVSATEVTCFAGSGPRIVTANLGDGDDHLGHHFGAVLGSFIRGGDGNDDIDGADGADSIDGGAGDDLLQGASNDDVLNGGPGNDLFLTNHLETGNDVKNGGDGNDRIIGDRDPGNDVYSGGAGVDLLDFRATEGGVAVSLDGVANDGPSGQADNAGTDLENIKGGRGNDTLVGNSGRNLIEGFAGNDTLRGGSPPTTRTDSPINFLGDDTLDGGIGSDVMHGEGGDDRLLARDAVDDQVAAAMTCGAGNDRLDTDLADDDTRPLPASCENIDQGAIDEGPNVRIAARTLRVSAAGTVRVRLSCPASVTSGCRGWLAAGAPGRVGLRALGARTRYRIRAGATRRVTIRLPRALRRAAARRSRVLARVVSLETGSHGPKTTVRRIRLR